MDIEYSYKGTKESAYEKLRAFFDILKAKYSKEIEINKVSWNSTKEIMNFNFQFNNFNFGGHMTIQPGKIIVKASGPSLAYQAVLGAEQRIRKTLEGIL
jgi:hypothetical protein